MHPVRKRYLMEYQASYTGLTFFRPDTSGVRGKGVGRKSYEFGDDEFPYNTAGVSSYGHPAAYDRSNAGHGGSRKNVPVPRDIGSDDDRFDEAEGWMSGTPVQGNIVADPEDRSKFGLDTDEALGVPFNVAKAGQGTGGAHTGGRVMPGTGGSWSSGPVGDHWDDEIDDDELERAGSIDEFSFGIPMAGNAAYKRKSRRAPAPEDDQVPSAKPHDSTDDELQGKLGNVDFGPVGHGMKYHRMQPGFTWKESLHRSLVEAFVTPAGTPKGVRATDVKDPEELDRSCARDTFSSVYNKGRGVIDSADEPDVVMFLMKIDPDRFSKSLGSIGKDRLSDIYDEWAESVLRSDGATIENIAQRIAGACGLGER